MLFFYILLIVFIASLVRSALGFGESLIAVPLLALFIPIEVAVPLSVLLSITIAAAAVLQDWRQIHFHSAKNLIFSSLFGIPIGLAILKFGDEQTVKVGLGVSIICFSIFSLISRPLPEIKGPNRAWTWACGFGSGILGAAYGMNGPPLIIYGSMRRWPPQTFRATLQGYFLPASAAGMIGYWKVGMWTSTVTNYYLLSLLAALPAFFIGRKINHSLPKETFSKVVYCGLLIIGIILLLGS